MANEVIYKHPNSGIVVDVDFSDDLPADSTITAGSTYVLLGSDSLTSTGLTITTGVATMTLTLNISSGTEGEDYLIYAKGIGTTSSKTAVRVIEVRVRSNRGFGNY
jgi:hypothetical protein